mmetsp:Transcript_92535/g.177681  ORF Transcript_92535/g.177681 Transcript_92535/m.177681 type:complete len:236 (+) Transcript_92535:75-782(+)
MCIILLRPPRDGKGLPRLWIASLIFRLSLGQLALDLHQQRSGSCSSRCDFLQACVCSFPCDIVLHHKCVLLGIDLQLAHLIRSNCAGEEPSAHLRLQLCILRRAKQRRPSAGGSRGTALGIHSVGQLLLLQAMESEVAMQKHGVIASGFRGLAQQKWPAQTTIARCVDVCQRQPHEPHQGLVLVQELHNGLSLQRRQHQIQCSPEVRVHSALGFARTLVAEARFQESLDVCLKQT